MLNIEYAYNLYKNNNYDKSLYYYLQTSLKLPALSPYLRINISRCNAKINNKSYQIKHPLFFLFGNGYSKENGAVLFDNSINQNSYKLVDNNFFCKRNKANKFAFIADTNKKMKPNRKIWGAEESASFVVQFGRELGYEVIEVDPLNWDEDEIAFADFLVLRSIERLSEKQLHFIKKIIFEKLKPYATYQHDYSFCKYRNSIKCSGVIENDFCNDCFKKNEYGRLQFYTNLLSRSSLNIFISHPQRHIFGEAMGSAIDPSIVILPPVNYNIFKKMDIERDNNLIVNCSGKLHSESKGFLNLAKYIDDNPNFKYKLYTEKNQKIIEFGHSRNNVEVLDPISNSELPYIYSQAYALVTMPSVMEPAGRTPIEAALCGCKVITNENVGCMYFNLPLEDPENLKKLINLSLNKLWNELALAASR